MNVTSINMGTIKFPDGDSYLASGLMIVLGMGHVCIHSLTLFNCLAMLLVNLYAALLHRISFLMIHTCIRTNQRVNQCSIAIITVITHPGTTTFLMQLQLLVKLTL